MIRLLRRLGRFPAGTETDFFDAAAEAAFVSDGTAETVLSIREDERAEESATEHTKTVGDYANMKKDDLLREAVARGLDVSPRAKVAEIVAALEASDGETDA